ncbi:MAG: hypothetical protein AAGH78_00675 [Cyanobacteria bacterium P01_H01_bin.58]
MKLEYDPVQGLIRGTFAFPLHNGDIFLDLIKVYVAEIQEQEGIPDVTKPEPQSTMPEPFYSSRSHF